MNIDEETKKDMECVLIDAVVNRAFSLQEDTGLDILECMRRVLTKHSTMGNKWLLSSDE